MREVVDTYIYENEFPGLGDFIYPGVTETLLALKQSGIKIGVLSEYPVEKKLRSSGLADVGWDLLMSCEEANAFEAPLHALVVACERLGVSRLVT